MPRICKHFTFNQWKSDTLLIDITLSRMVQIAVGVNKVENKGLNLQDMCRHRQQSLAQDQWLSSLAR